MEWVWISNLGILLQVCFYQLCKVIELYLFFDLRFKIAYLNSNAPSSNFEYFKLIVSLI